MLVRMTLAPSVDVEMDHFHEAVPDDEIWHDASDSCPVLENPIAGVLDAQEITTGGDVAKNSSHDLSQSSLATVNVVGTWAAAAIAIGALSVAVYYGYWSLRLQRWSAIKDFRDQCQIAHVQMLSIRRSHIIFQQHYDKADENCRSITSPRWIA